MLRSLILLITINISFHTLANWQENYFKLGTSYSFATTDMPQLYQKPSHLHKFSLSAEKQYLGSGYGLNLKGKITPNYIDQADLQERKVTEHLLQAQSILFLSPNSDFSASYINNKSLQHFDNRLENIVQSASEELVSDVEHASLDFTLGKDKSFFFLKLNYDHINEVKTVLFNDVNFQTSSKDKASIDLLWRQSEDTLWGTKLEHTTEDRKVFGDDQSFEVNNYYLTFVSNYLSSSQLSVQLGSSEAKQQNQFSWHVNHKTFFSEYSSFSARSFRKFEQAIDSSGEEELNTRHQLKFSYKPLKYLDSELNYSTEQRKQASTKTYQKDSLALTLSVTYQDSWKLSASYEKQNLKVHTNNQDISQSMIGFSISRDLV